MAEVDVREDAPALLHELISAAIEAARPEPGLRKALNHELDRLRAARALFVLGVGKAAAEMSDLTVAFLADHGLDIEAGLVVTPHGSPASETLPTCHAGHPFPDTGSLDAAQRARDFIARAGRDDVVIALVSGGTSALLAAPRPPLDLDMLVELNARLHASGMPIELINPIRIALSTIKGGGLAAATSAVVLSCVLSDVVGGPPSLVGSGPTLASDDAALLLGNARETAIAIDLPRRFLDAMTAPRSPEKAGPCHVVGDVDMARRAVASAAAQNGLLVRDFDRPLLGEARRAGRFVADATTLMNSGECLVWGGETVVTLNDAPGRGGRNQELALAAATHGLANDVWLAAFGTDGRDGPTDVAGAVVTRLDETRRTSALEALEAHDSWHFFERHGGHIITGPTGTNVNDITIALRL